MLETNSYLLAFSAILLGSVVQSLIGFGMAVVAAPLLFMIDPRLVPVPLLLQGTTISVMNYWRYRANANLRSVSLALLWRVPGSLLGLWLLLHFQHNLLSVLIALAVLMGVATTLTQRSLPVNRWSLSAAGFLSGIFSTTAAIGGPPMALLLRNQQTASLRANLSAFFTVSCLISIAILAVAGQINRQHLYLAASLLPAVFLGFQLAKRFTHYIEKHHVQRLTQILCTLCAFALLYQTLYTQ